MNCYTERYSVLSHDVDSNNNARPSVISRLMQETANHHMRDRKPTYYDLFFSGKSFIATRIAFELLEQLHPYDVVDVHTWTCENKGATFLRCHMIEKEGRTVARSYTEWAIADLNSGRLCRTNEFDFSNYEQDEPNKLLVPVRFRFPKEARIDIVDSKVVKYCDCDMNMHMNNTFYQDMIWNAFPDVEKRKLTSFSLRFMAEAHLGDEIKIERAVLDEPVEDGAGAEYSCYFRTTVGDRINTEALVSGARAERQKLF